MDKASRHSGNRAGVEIALNTPPFPATPGAELLDRISDAAFEHDLPHIKLGTLPGHPWLIDVPRIENLFLQGVRLRDTRSAFKTTLAIALDSGNDHAYAALSAHELKRLRWMAATALKDIGGMDYYELADACELGTAEAAKDWVIGKHGSPGGRKLLRQLNAWPWIDFGPGGTPPSGWRHGHAGGRTQSLLGFWRAGEPAVTGSFSTRPA